MQEKSVQGKRAEAPRTEGISMVIATCVHSQTKSTADTSEVQGRKIPNANDKAFWLTLVIKWSFMSAHDFILCGIQVLDQKVRGHFPFTFYFNFTPLNDFKPLIFQGSAQRNKEKHQVSKTTGLATVQEEKSQTQDTQQGGRRSQDTGQGLQRGQRELFFLPHTQPPPFYWTA